ncbi:hypothetical protein BOX15_Mlig007078g1 [Macrostomum lignano]|uniref:Uncharacterized protein n=1 Tax=Macrostomum lignano TaxID=282301 RepID=A0A267GT56_9PLAT|nr:hypothetical protein BOX15_Mlig007078g2 [Macrostomum lignano]PAA83139.1 hypothetical protein BOX15_Mlig007078g3 [Macrostomum lignano]PAA88489.1 hypothetical protein BOX15_Mlig007078g1 [Macrostomum lignano]
MKLITVLLVALIAAAAICSARPLEVRRFGGKRWWPVKYYDADNIQVKRVGHGRPSLELPASAWDNYPDSYISKRWWPVNPHEGSGNRRRR